MRTSKYFTTTTCLILLLLSFLLFSCVGPEPLGSSPTATGVTEAVSPTVISSAKTVSPKYFSYVVKVSDKDAQKPIQEAEVSIELDLSEEIFGPMATDSTGQVVFTFEADQAGQGIELTVKAEGYLEQIFKRALKLDGPTEEVELSSLTPPTPTYTSTPTPTETPSPSPTPENTATPMPTPTDPPNVPSPTPEDTPTSTPTPTETPTITPTATPSIPTGNLAIPVVFNFGTKVYLTGFDGIGINGPNYISIGGMESSEDARQPMFSSDGESVMVKATIDGVTGLHKLTASGFNPEIIIRRGSADWPVLSPDGKTVLFSEATLDYRLHKRTPSDEVETPDYLIEEIRLNGFSILARNLLWSENNQLVFQGCAVWIQEPGTCGTWVTSANNLNPQRIIVGNDAQPMAVRGNVLAYMQRETGKDWDIFLKPLDGGPAVDITNNDFEDGLPAISPDGNAVAYISNESGTWGLWTVNLDGQNKKHWFDINPGSGVFDTDEWSQDRMSWRQ